MTAKLNGVARLLCAGVLGAGLFMLVSSLLGRVASSGVAVQDGGASASLSRSATVPGYDARIGQALQGITTGTLTVHERALTGVDGVIISGQRYTLTTRNSYSGESISQATRYVYELFQGFDLDVGFHDYLYNGHQWRNVVAERPGLRRPDEIYLITAHLDDMPAWPTVPAPGADDNASGSAGVLVAAETLSRFDFDCTVRFVLFTGEEQGLRGSAAYAGGIAAAGETVHGVLNLDMIAYNSDADYIVDLHARSSVSGSLAIAETFSQVVAAYDLKLIPNLLVDQPLGNYSDNRSFWDQGYPAILAIENWDGDDRSPYYHTSSDTIDTLDLDYMVEFVRASVATYAHMGCIASTGLLTGTVTDFVTGLPLSATVTALGSTGDYATNTGARGFYSLTLPADRYTLRAWADRSDYLPAAFPNVAVLTDTMTVQHFALRPVAARLFFPLWHKQP